MVQLKLENGEFEPGIILAGLPLYPVGTKSPELHSGHIKNKGLFDLIPWCSLSFLSISLLSS